MEQMRDTKCVKSMTHSLYFYFAAKIRTLLRTRVANFPSILPVFDKVAKLLHLQCNNIGKTNTRNKDRAYLPVTIWVNLCCVMQLFYNYSLNQEVTKIFENTGATNKCGSSTISWKNTCAGVVALAGVT